MNKIVVGIVAAVLILVGIIFWTFKNNSYLSFDDDNKTYAIEEQWNLPKILEEVSGISYLGNNEMACVQDEDGILFIYNLETSKITSRISFGDSGDYEALTVVEETAYIARSDGKIFKVTNFRIDALNVYSYQIS